MLKHVLFWSPTHTHGERERERESAITITDLSLRFSKNRAKDAFRACGTGATAWKIECHSYEVVLQ